MRVSRYDGGNFRVPPKASVADGSGYLSCLISLALEVEHY